MNLDEGNQASEGEDKFKLGTIANPNIDLDTFTGEEYALMTLTSERRSFEIICDDQGVVWLIAGTDSGFEGPNGVYYSSIVGQLNEITQEEVDRTGLTHEMDKKGSNLHLASWNPFQLSTLA
jgi:hypothetical protein